jgi:HAD superfamily hydrolase (TIGR01509 family)
MHKPYAIFDMDGTLVDSMVYWKRLGREYLTGKGVTEGLDDLLERVKPMTMSESAALFAAECGIPGTADAIAAEMNAVMEDHYRSDIPLKSGVAAYLRRLRREGVTMCVASATAEELVDACLTRLGVADCFAFLLSCEAVGSGKNRPDVYLEAARRLGAPPGQIAVYEDALYAAQTARDAGFHTVAVYDALADASWPELSALADESIRDWAEAAAQR